MYCLPHKHILFHTLPYLSLTDGVQVNNWFINARRRTPRKEAEKKLDRERGVTETSDDSMNNSEMTSVFRHLQQEPLRLQYP